MAITAQQALAVLEDAVTSRRARAALAVVRDDIAGSREPSGGPQFPTSTSVAQMMSGKDSARGGHSS